MIKMPVSYCHCLVIYKQTCKLFRQFRAESFLAYLRLYPKYSSVAIQKTSQNKTFFLHSYFSLNDILTPPDNYITGFQFRCLNDFHGVCKLGKTVMIYDIFSQGNLSKGIGNCSGVALFVFSGVTVA